MNLFSLHSELEQQFTLGGFTVNSEEKESYIIIKEPSPYNWRICSGVSHWKMIISLLWNENGPGAAGSSEKENSAWCNMCYRQGSGCGLRYHVASGSSFWVLCHLLLVSPLLLVAISRAVPKLEPPNYLENLLSPTSRDSNSVGWPAAQIFIFNQFPCAAAAA